MAARFEQKWHLMPGVHVAELAAHQVQNTFKRRDEQPLAVGLTQHTVDLGKDIPQIHAGLGVVFDERLADDHEQRRRYTLAGYVGHDDGKVAIIHHEEIIKIAADLLGRIHRGVDVKFLAVGESREDTGQHRFLDMRCHIQFSADSFFLGGDGRNFLDVGGDVCFHLLQRIVQRFDFITRADVQRGKHRLFALRCSLTLRVACRSCAEFGNGAQNRFVRHEQKQHQHQRGGQRSDGGNLPKEGLAVGGYLVHRNID